MTKLPMVITFITFIFFWAFTIIICLNYIAYKDIASVKLIPKNHPFFWFQSYHGLLARYSKPYLIINLLLCSSLSIYSSITQEEPYTESVSCWCSDEKGEITGIVVNKVGCVKGAEKMDSTVPVNCAFPNGGGGNLYSFFEKNKNNPTRETGTVYVSFYVLDDGSLTDFSISSSDNTALNNEAIRLVKEYPEGWKPAISHGQEVKQRVVLPIQF
jgi:TonB family protein